MPGNTQNLLGFCSILWKNWWFGTWLFWLSIYWEWKIIPTDELTPSFFRGVASSTTNEMRIDHHHRQMPRRIFLQSCLSPSLFDRVRTPPNPRKAARRHLGLLENGWSMVILNLNGLKCHFPIQSPEAGSLLNHFKDRPTLQLWTFEAGTQQGVELTALDWWKQPEMDQYLWQLSVNLWWWWWRWRWWRSRCGYSILTLLIYWRLRHGRAELLQEYSKQEDKHHYKQARLAQQSGKVLTDWLERMTSWLCSHLQKGM